MPHIRIQHFEPALPPELLIRLSSAVTASVREVIGCTEDAISIAVQPVAALDWAEHVYQSVIAAEAQWLVKAPGYGHLAGATS